MAFEQYSRHKSLNSDGEVVFLSKKNTLLRCKLLSEN